jgi:cob(I)alamin adenosyltransferase
MLYTKYGDQGFTYTKHDPKTPKNHALVFVLGEIDELNCNIGYLHASICAKKNSEICDYLKKIMNVLFEIGAFVGYGQNLSESILVDEIKNLENKIDSQEKENGELKNFILPTGSENSALAHICRAVCRRVERNIYMLESPLHYDMVKKFLNRLSDYFFSLARTINRLELGKEIIWQSSK